MDIHEFAGTDKIRDTATHDEIYNKIIDALGGTDAVRPYIPFTNETLTESYARDKNFNDDLTPLKSWDKAAGFDNGYRGAGGVYRPTGYGLWSLLHRHGVTSITPSQAVCVLKHAAARHVQALNAEKGTRPK